MLEKEIQFFQKHQAEWRTSHPGKHVIVKGRQLVGVFDSFDDALSAGAGQFGLKPFLLRSVEHEDEEVYIPALTVGVLRADPEFADDGGREGA